MLYAWPLHGFAFLAKRIGQPDDIVFGRIGQRNGNLLVSKALFLQSLDHIQHGRLDREPTEETGLPRIIRPVNMLNHALTLR